MHVTFCTQNYNFDKITAILTLTFQALVSSIDCCGGGSWVGMGKGVKPGLGHGGIICVLQTQFAFFWGGGAGELAFYFEGTLENNSLFLGNKTNVR